MAYPKRNGGVDVSPRGSLFVVGGGADRCGDRVLLDRFVTICGGPSVRILVVSTASSEPKRQQREYEQAFQSLGVSKVTYFHQSRPEEAEQPALLKATERAQGVFFTGGSQQRLVANVGGTSFAK